MLPWPTNPHAGPLADTPEEDLRGSMSRFQNVNQLHPSDVQDMPDGVRGAFQASDNRETQAAFAKVWTHFVHETNPTRAQQMVPMPQLPLSPPQNPFHLRHTFRLHQRSIFRLRHPQSCSQQATPQSKSGRKTRARPTEISASTSLQSMCNRP